MPFKGLTSSETWFLMYGTITDFMASSHLTESGPIIASLHVVGSSLSNNNDLFLNLIISSIGT
jgi:hypothetical protein